MSIYRSKSDYSLQNGYQFFHLKSPIGFFTSSLPFSKSTLGYRFDKLVKNIKQGRRIFTSHPLFLLFTYKINTNLL